MYNKSYNDRPSGGKRDWNKPQSRGSWKQDSFARGSGPTRGPSFDAVCSGCGKDCKVPFRPNGSKPVYCTNCFKREGNTPNPSFSGGNSSSRPSFRDAREQRSAPPSGGSDSRELQEQLRVINSKLDAILRAMDV
jgi:CxxC-x17-CxxC domain-containing protein